MDTGSRSSAQSALLSSTRAKMTAEDAPGHRQQQQQQHERLPPPVLEGILKTKQQPFGQRTHSVGQAGSILAERSRLPQVKKHASFALTHTHVSGNQSGTNNQSVSGHTHNLSFDMATTNSSNSGATVSSGANKCVSSVHTGALVETAKSQSPAGNTISVGSNSNQLTNDNTANDNNSNNNTNTNQASYYQRRLSLAGLGRRQRAVTMDNNVEFVGQKLAATTTSSKARPEKKPSLSTPDAKSLRSSVAVGVGVKDKDKGKDNSNKDLGIVRAIGLKIASGRSINNDTALAGVGGKKPLTKSRTTSSSKYSATKQPSRALSLSKSFMSSSSSSSLLSSSSEPLDSLSLDSSNSTTFTLTSDDEDTARDVLSRRRFKLNNEQLRLQRKCTPYTYTDADGILVTDLDSISLINTSSESESGPSNETSSASGNDDDTLALSESRPAIISEVVKQPGVNEITSNTNNNTADTNARNIDDNRKDVATTADCQQPQQEQQLQSASCQVSNKVSVSTANEQQKQQQAESNVPVSSSLRNKVVKRSRYAWCPANLTKEHIGAFFAKFPKDKVPLIDTPGDEYRTRQIDYQLPAQDMALEYCKYVDTNDARHSYHEFITQRSTKALDVGHAVRLIDAKYRATSPTDMDSTLVVSSSSSSSSSCSTTSNGSSVVKCRRCLCQINNIAVVAPKFLVGTSLASSVTPVSASSSTLADGSGHSKKTDNGQAVPPAGIEQLTNTDAARRLSNSGIQAPLSTGIFHPECFTCYTCKEWLVDLIYCFKDNRIYCVRHYGEIIRPRCGMCQELIFSDEYSKAMGDDFHVGHFMCQFCNKNLAGQRYVLKDEQSYCTDCYETKFANTCEDCRKPIGIDSRDLSYKDKHWHDACFVCSRCSASLIDKPFGTKSEKIYCADCYDTSFATKCDACQNPFRAGSKKMEYRGRQWHDSCFCCCVCKNTIGSNSFIPKDESIYCIKCYEDKFATKCTKCKLVIASGGVTFRNEPWHRECFQCCHCAKSLAGVRFTTHDSDKNDAAQYNKTGQAHNAYCIDCYSRFFAKKCFACSEPITGVGGTRFVTFEDRNWHNDCFVCTDCRQSLVGKGFITDGPNEILCAECARAKLR